MSGRLGGGEKKILVVGRGEERRGEGGREKLDLWWLSGLVVVRRNGTGGREGKGGGRRGFEMREGRRQEAWRTEGEKRRSRYGRARVDVGLSYPRKVERGSDASSSSFGSTIEKQIEGHCLPAGTSVGVETRFPTGETGDGMRWEKCSRAMEVDAAWFVQTSPYGSEEQGATPGDEGTRWGTSWGLGP